jgi:hypothetical protein
MGRRNDGPVPVHVGSCAGLAATGLGPSGDVVERLVVAVVVVERAWAVRLHIDKQRLDLGVSCRRELLPVEMRVRRSSTSNSGKSVIKVVSLALKQ